MAAAPPQPDPFCAGWVGSALGQQETSSPFRAIDPRGSVMAIIAARTVAGFRGGGAHAGSMSMLATALVREKSVDRRDNAELQQAQNKKQRPNSFETERVDGSQSDRAGTTARAP